MLKRTIDHEKHVYLNHSDSVISKTFFSLHTPAVLTCQRPNKKDLPQQECMLVYALDNYVALPSSTKTMIEKSIPHYLQMFHGKRPNQGTSLLSVCVSRKSSDTIHIATSSAGHSQVGFFVLNASKKKPGTYTTINHRHTLNNAAEITRLSHDPQLLAKKMMPCYEIRSHLREDAVAFDIPMRDSKDGNAASYCLIVTHMKILKKHGLGPLDIQTLVNQLVSSDVESMLDELQNGILTFIQKTRPTKDLPPELDHVKISIDLKKDRPDGTLRLHTLTLTRFIGYPLPGILYEAEQNEVEIKLEEKDQLFIIVATDGLDAIMGPRFPQKIMNLISRGFKDRLAEKLTLQTQLLRDKENITAALIPFNRLTDTKFSLTHSLHIDLFKGHGLEGDVLARDCLLDGYELRRLMIQNRNIMQWSDALITGPMSLPSFLFASSPLQFEFSKHVQKYLLTTAQKIERPALLTEKWVTELTPLKLSSAELLKLREWSKEKKSSGPHMREWNAFDAALKLIPPFDPTQKELSFSIYTEEPFAVAELLTYELRRHYLQLLPLIWHTEPDLAEDILNASLFIRFSIQLLNFFTEDLLLETPLEQRIEKINFWLEVASHSLKLDNQHLAYLIFFIIQIFEKYHSTYFPLVPSQMHLYLDCISNLFPITLSHMTPDLSQKQLEQFQCQYMASLSDIRHQFNDSIVPNAFLTELVRYRSSAALFTEHKESKDVAHFIEPLSLFILKQSWLTQYEKHTLLLLSAKQQEILDKIKNTIATKSVEDLEKEIARCYSEDEMREKLIHRRIHSPKKSSSHRIEAVKLPPISLTSSKESKLPITTTTHTHSSHRPSLKIGAPAAQLFGPVTLPPLSNGEDKKGPVI